MSSSSASSSMRRHRRRRRPPAPAWLERILQAFGGKRATQQGSTSTLQGGVGGGGGLHLPRRASRDDGHLGTISLTVDSYFSMDDEIFHVSEYEPDTALYGE